MAKRMHPDPPYPFLKSYTTFIENWPQAFVALALPMTQLPLSEEEVHALGSRMLGFSQWFSQLHSQTAWSLLRQRITQAVDRHSNGAFIRLGSRSPKDSLQAMRNGMRVYSGDEALRLLLEGSHRVAVDLRLALDHRHQPQLVVRPWVEFPEWSEFRCFMVGYQFVGATQYACDSGQRFTEIAVHEASILKALNFAMTKVAACAHLPAAVFDFVVLLSGCETHARLIDVNPLLPVTALGLFDDPSHFDGTLRYRLYSGEIQRTRLGPEEHSLEAAQQVMSTRFC